jgi:histidinol-phosphate aminotransferase
MSSFINEKMKKIEPYIPNEAIYKIKLDANESSIPISSAIRQEIAKAIAENPLNRYPDPMSTEVCEAFARLYQLKTEQVVAGCGSDELINVIISFFLEENDKILCFSPDFTMYAFYAQVHGNTCVTIPKGEDMVLTSQMIIDSAKREKPKLILFSNPCNPTGIGLMKEEVVEVLKNVDSLVVVDEAYMDFWNQSVLDEIENFDNLIVLRTCSKAFAAAGLRLGFAVAQKQLVDEIKKAKSPYNVNLLTQIAAPILFGHAQEIRTSVVTIIETRKYIYNRLKEFAKGKKDFCIFKSGANFIYFKCNHGNEIFEELKASSIIIRNFNNGYLRLSIGTQEEMEFVIEKFIAAYEKYNQQ